MPQDNSQSPQAQKNVYRRSDGDALEIPAEKPVKKHEKTDAKERQPRYSDGGIIG